MNDEKNESSEFEERGDEEEAELSPLDPAEVTPVSELLEPVDVVAEPELEDSDSLEVDATEPASSFEALSSGATDSAAEDSALPETSFASAETSESVEAKPRLDPFAPSPEASQDDAPALSEQEQRDGDSLVLLGGFLSVLALPVLIGTFFVREGERHAMIVNVVAGLILLAIGVGLVLRGRFLLGRPLLGRPQLGRFFRRS